jgi:hypothetical protein
MQNSQGNSAEDLGQLAHDMILEHRQNRFDALRYIFGFLLLALGGLFFILAPINDGTILTTGIALAIGTVMVLD